jgi:hypothetical protein
VGGRTLHARGNLGEAERLLTEAVATAVGEDRLTAAAWLGVLHSHRSRPERAIELLRPATQPGVGADHTSATLHALLFTGHAHALAGNPVLSLDAFGRYTEEVERRQVPRFGGRGVNFTGWVLRNLGATEAALDLHQEALACAEDLATTEVRVAALEDLAEERLVAGDADAATAFLDRARAALVGALGGGWRVGLKRAMRRARLALVVQRPEEALHHATELRSAADRVGVPRYASVASLLVHHAHAALGEPVDHDTVSRDLDVVEQSVAVEAWWWTGATAAALGQDRWLTRAETLAGTLATRSGPYADALHAEAGRRIDQWRRQVR